MKGFSLLSLVAVMLRLVSGQDRPCGAEQRCVSASSCQSFTVEKLKFDQLKPGSEEKRRLLKTLRSLVCNKKERKVCCEVSEAPVPDGGNETEESCQNSTAEVSDSPSYLPSLEREECGLAGASFSFIFGGETTHLAQFPFMALVGKIKGRTTKWDCGGSIINKWFVLSAAHCGSRVDLVRLGEWRVEESQEDVDCEYVDHGNVRHRLCSEPHQV